MKNLRNKTTATAIALFLMLAMFASFAVLPIANAAVNYYQIWMYVSVSHSVIGVNQQLLLVMWTAQLPPDIGESVGAVPGERAAWYGETMIVTKPDGTNETLALPKSDPVGSGYFAYVPDQIGTYYIQAFFPATWKNTTATQAYYNSAVSNIESFTVQEEPIISWPEAPLPTAFWTRPVNVANREWDVLLGNWLGLSSAAHNVGPTVRLGYGEGPESAHIMWTKPYQAGGMMDARFDDKGYATTHYQGLTFSPIIMQGILYYPARDTPHTTQGWYAVDLYTGETLRFDNSTMPSFGQIYDYESPNQHGGFPYLWRTSDVTVNGNPGGINGTVWEMLDAYTGQSICKIANVTSGGTAVYGKDGSILRYNTVNLGTTAAPNYYLQVWNNTAIPSLLSGDTGTNAWQWRPATGGRGQNLGGDEVHDGSKAFSLNVSIPSVLGPRNAISNQTGTIRAVREDELMIVGTTGQNDERGIVQGWLMGVSLELGREGTKLWDITFTPPSSAGNKTISLSFVDPEDGVFIFRDGMLRQWYGYSLATGQQLWKSESEAAWEYYGMNGWIYQGMLLDPGDGMCAGILYAYNITTGELLWTYTPSQVGFESPYGNFPLAVTCIVDGKIYMTSGEHSPTTPLWRGSYLRCVNASNGVELWKVLHWGSSQNPGSAAGMVYPSDGFLVGLNLYDAQIYCYGKGPSVTTVTASPEISVHGNSVLVQGMVTDESAGAKKLASQFGFANGVPAIADISMQAWMEYLYARQGIPGNATGVDVTLDALDPNGNFVHIGTTTSDMSGLFSHMFTPEVPGKYTIIATFEGSASYYGSYAETAIGVDEAPTATAGPEYPQPIDNTLTIVAVGIAIIIVVVIVGLMILRRKP